jgi:hypothetical protein
MVARLGAIGLIMAQHYNPKGDKPIMAGLLLSSEAGMSQRKSVLMLVSHDDRTRIPATPTHHDDDGC